MPEPLWTTDDIEALKLALRRGVRRVRKDGEEVEFNSLHEMRELLSSMQQSVAAASGDVGAIKLRPHKGYDR